MDFAQRGAEIHVFIPECGVPILVWTLPNQPQDCFIFIFALSPPSRSSYTEGLPFRNSFDFILCDIDTYGVSLESFGSHEFIELNMPNRKMLPALVISL
jgi:hypothetical protein